MVDRNRAARRAAWSKEHDKNFHRSRTGIHRSVSRFQISVHPFFCPVSLQLGEVMPLRVPNSAKNEAVIRRPQPHPEGNCGRQDLNLHRLPHTPLKRARLPISPLPQSRSICGINQPLLPTSRGNPPASLRIRKFEAKNTSQGVADSSRLPEQHTQATNSRFLLPQNRHKRRSLVHAGRSLEPIHE